MEYCKKNGVGKLTFFGLHIVLCVFEWMDYRCNVVGETWLDSDVHDSCFVFGGREEGREGGRLWSSYCHTTKIEFDFFTVISLVYSYKCCCNC